VQKIQRVEARLEELQKQIELERERVDLLDRLLALESVAGATPQDQGIQIRHESGLSSILSPTATLNPGSA
jgi:hypothetical protein